MIKVKYKIDRDSQIENADYDLSSFEYITVCFDTNGDLTICSINDKIAINNTVVIVDKDQKVEDIATRYK